MFIALLSLSICLIDSYPYLFLNTAQFIVLAASAIRLSYFSTYGLSGESKYTGLALDNNSLILVAVFLLESLMPRETFSVLFYVSALSLAILNVSQIKTPKLSGNPRNVYILAFYTLAITAIYAWKLA